MLVICGTRQTSSGVYEITPDSGSAFFLRTAYLSLVKEEQLLPVIGGLGASDSLYIEQADLKPGMQGVFSDEEAQDILHAALVYSVEAAAMTYLARCEHCRASLQAKLLKKNLDAAAVEQALDYLESVSYLSDRRFAGAWLQTRYIDHAEGRRRLSSELAARGVDSEAAKLALNEYFEEHDEAELCARAYRKYLRLHSNPDSDKLISSLTRLGFNYSLIKKTIAKVSSE